MANMVYDKDIDFSAYMEESEPRHKIVKASNFVDEVVEYYHSDKPVRGARLPWEKTHALLRFRPGETTLWTGFNGHGKSLLLGQACIGFVTQAQKVCIASFEMKPQITLARIVRQAFSSSVPSREEIHGFHEVTDAHLWLYDQQGTVKTKFLLAVLRYAATELRIDHFVIDSLMKCGVKEDDFAAQQEFMDAITSIGRDTGMHIHLVAHSRKAKDESAPSGKMDVKGSGAITDQVDNVIAVWRNKPKEMAIQDNDRGKNAEPDALLICDKQRNGEWEGKIGLWYKRAPMQFVASEWDDAMDMLAL